MGNFFDMLKEMCSGNNIVFFKSYKVVFKSTSSSFCVIEPALEYSKTSEINVSIVSSVVSIKSKF